MIYIIHHFLFYFRNYFKLYKMTQAFYYRFHADNFDEIWTQFSTIMVHSRLWQRYLCTGNCSSYPSKSRQNCPACLFNQAKSFPREF